MKWHSYHIFIHDMTYHDQFLTHYLKPLLESEKENLEQFFFIRYWQGGPHIRFRFRSVVPERIVTKLKETVNRFRLYYTPCYQLDKSEYYENHTFDGFQPKEEELYWHEDGTFIEIPYEPEIERYGGELAIEHSEKLFQHSSTLALEVLGFSQENKGLVKLLHAADFISMVCSLIDAEQADELRENYHSFWLGFAKINLANQSDQLRKLYRVWERQTQLHNRAIYQETKREFSGQLKKITSVNPAFSRNYLLASHIHMFNNRIGMSPELEHMVPFLLDRKELGRRLIHV